MDTIGNGLKKPSMTTDIIDDVVSAVATNATICDSQFTKINDATAIDSYNHLNIQSPNIFGTHAILNFIASRNANNLAQIISYSDGGQPAGNLFIEPQNYLVIRSLFSTPTTNAPVNTTFYGSVNVVGNFGVNGAKNRLVQTKTYGQIGLNAVESAECVFNDYGRAKLISGQCKINIDNKFLETVNTKDYQYDVYLTKYGQGDIWVDFDSMTETYFRVIGTSDINFGYQIVAKQLGYEDIRLKEIDNHIPDNTSKYAELYFKDKLNNNQNSGE